MPSDFHVSIHALAIVFAGRICHWLVLLHSPRGTEFVSLEAHLLLDSWLAEEDIVGIAWMRGHCPLWQQSDKQDGVQTATATFYAGFAGGL